MSKNSVKAYPKWLKVLWRFFRVFLDGVIGVVTTEVLLAASGKEVDEGLKYLLCVTVGAGLAAVTKRLRENAKSYDSVIHSVPL
jgi:hypothetical protein